MGILDIFKKKKNTDSTFPENELERSLKDTATMFSARSDFYTKLLWNNLIVITKGNSNTTEGVRTLEEGTSVHILALESGQIPIFTSTNRIFDRGVVKEEVPFMAMKGQDLFELAKGATFILNPYSDYSKEFSSQEIENLMDGSIFDRLKESEIEQAKYDAFNAIFQRAGEMQKGLVLLDNYSHKELTETARNKLNESIKGYKKCLELVPDHWQSMFFMAKCYQRIGNHEEALELLERAFEIELDNPSIALEASTEAMHLKDLDKALYYSQASLKRKPNDAAIMGNHALNLLVGKKDEEARIFIEKAIKIQPIDPINRNIESMIKNVISGKKERPTFEDVIN